MNHKDPAMKLFEKLKIAAVAFAVIATPIVLACKATPVTQAEIDQYEEVIQKLDGAKSEIIANTEGVYTPEQIAEAVAALEAEIETVKQLQVELERDDITMQAATVVELFGHKLPLPEDPVVLGAGLMALAPLLGKRGRSHFGDAFLNLFPFISTEKGSKKIDVVAFLDSLAKMQGIKGTDQTDSAAKVVPVATGTETEDITV